jgi:hypothetical protein
MGKGDFVMLGKQISTRLRHRKLKIPAGHAVNEEALLLFDAARKKTPNFGLKYFHLEIVCNNTVSLHRATG